MIVIKCDKCKKEFEIFMESAEPPYVHSSGVSFGQVITVIIPIHTMHAFSVQGSGEMICKECK